MKKQYQLLKLKSKELIQLIGFLPLWLSLSLLLVSCQSAKKNIQKNTLTSNSSGIGNSKLYIKDKKNNRSYALNMKYAISRPNLMLSISHPLGIQVGKLSLRKNRFDFISVKDRTYYYGKPSPAVLKKAFDIDLDPNYLFGVLLGNEKELGSEVSCDGSHDGPICYVSKNKVTIIVYKKEPLVKIKSDDVDIKIKRQSFKDQEFLDDSLFNIKAPKAYKKIELK